MTNPSQTTKLPLGVLRPSPTNPRKTFPEASLAELAASIAQVGVLQPLLVRPITYTVSRGPTKGRHEAYEIVAGERRFRAAALAKLTEVPVVVRDLTDREVLECQLTENEQREDVRPSEQAAAYANLVKAGVTVDEIATRIGRSASTVRAILLLDRMPAKLREAVDAGAVPVSTATLVCRVPSEFFRERVATCVVDGIDWYNDDTFADPKTKIKDKYNRSDGPLTFRDTKNLISRLCMVELKQASFSRKSLDLVPAAGSCDACPKRAGNDSELVAEGIRADICTDPGCFRQKTEAQAELVKQQAEKDGRKVLPGKESEKLFYSGGQLRSDAPYVDLAGHVYDPRSRKNKPFSKLLKSVADQAVVAIDDDGCPHNLIPRADAVKVLKAAGITIDRYGSVHAGGRARAKTDTEKAEEARRRETNKVTRLTNQEILKRIGAAMAGYFPVEDEDQPRTLISHLVANALDSMWGDNLELMAGVHAIEHKGGVTDARDAIKKTVKEWPIDSQFALLIECLLIRDVAGYGSNRMAAVLKEFGIDRKAIEQQARNQLRNPSPTAASAPPHANGKPVKPALQKRKSSAKPTVATAAADVATCRVCGCTDADCRQCIAKTGHPCHWIEPDLCSACVSASGAGVPRTAGQLIHRDTLLSDLLPPSKGSPADGRALEAWDDQPTIGRLLSRIGSAKKNESYTSKVYAYLRTIKGLSSDAVNAIGDALVDAGLLGADAPTPDVQHQRTHSKT